MEYITAHPVVALFIVGGVWASVLVIGVWLLLRGTVEEDDARERAAYLKREHLRRLAREACWAEVRRQVEAERVRQQWKGGR